MSKSSQAVIATDQISSNGKPTDKQSTAAPLSQGPLPPTISELALVAATLRRNGEHDLNRLVTEAYKLWEACELELKQRREARRDFLDELCTDLPKPEKYPLSFAGFLKLMLPQRRQPDRESAYRHFLMDWKRIGMEETGDLMAKQKVTPVDHWDFCQLGPLFSEWIKVDLSWKKKLNGLRGRGGTSPDRLAAEEKQGAQERSNVVAKAAEKWNDATLKTLRKFPV